MNKRAQRIETLRSALQPCSLALFSAWRSARRGWHISLRCQRLYFSMRQSNDNQKWKSFMISRRDVGKGIAGLGLGALASRIPCASAQAAAPASPRVLTSGGTVEGLAQGNVLRFLGIPYGASTAGDSRFIPPRPPRPWSGVREAKAFGDTCPQVPLGMSPFARKDAADKPPPEPTAIQKQLAMLFTRPDPQPKQSEDCLV